MGQFVLNFSKTMRRKNERIRDAESDCEPRIAEAQSQPEEREETLNADKVEEPVVLSMA